MHMPETCCPDCLELDDEGHIGVLGAALTPTRWSCSIKVIRPHPTLIGVRAEAGTLKSVPSLSIKSPAWDSVVVRLHIIALKATNIVSAVARVWILGCCRVPVCGMWINACPVIAPPKEASTIVGKAETSVSVSTMDGANRFEQRMESFAV